MRRFLDVLAFGVASFAVVAGLMLLAEIPAVQAWGAQVMRMAVGFLRAAQESNPWLLCLLVSGLMTGFYAVDTFLRRDREALIEAGVRSGVDGMVRRFPEMDNPHARKVLGWYFRASLETFDVAIRLLEETDGDPARVRADGRGDDGRHPGAGGDGDGGDGVLRPDRPPASGG